MIDKENTNLTGGITVWLTSCLFCLDSAALHLCFAYVELSSVLLVWLNPNQSYRMSAVPYDECSLD